MGFFVYFFLFLNSAIWSVLLLLLFVIAHPYPEQVDLTLHSMSSSTDQQGRIIHSTTFNYYDDTPEGGSSETVLVDLFRQSILDMGKSLLFLCGSYPQGMSTEEVRRLDGVFCDILKASELPEGWSLVGSLGKPGTRGSSVNGRFLWSVCI